jgi:hypothetical protein
MAFLEHRGAYLCCESESDHSMFLEEFVAPQHKCIHNITVRYGAIALII